jgi:hypothetical protein
MMMMILLSFWFWLRVYLAADDNISEEHASAIFRQDFSPEDGDSMFLRKVI